MIVNNKYCFCGYYVSRGTSEDICLTHLFGMIGQSRYLDDAFQEIDIMEHSIYGLANVVVTITITLVVTSIS